MSLVSAAYGAMSVVLVLSGAALLYPAVTGVQVVVYRTAVFALGASALLFVAGWLVSDLTYHGLVHDDTLYVVSSVVITAAAALHFVAVWLFARDFVQFDADQVAIGSGDTHDGGFADERE